MIEDARDQRLLELYQNALSGGFSVTKDLADAPHTGFFVSFEGGQEIPEQSFTPGDIDIAAHTVGDDYLGAWFENGVIYLDRSVRFDSEPEAMLFGRANHQQAIYDANTETVLTVTPQAPSKAPQNDSNGFPAPTLSPTLSWTEKPLERLSVGRVKTADSDEGCQECGGELDAAGICENCGMPGQPLSLYHVAPRAARESIQQHGLDWNHATERVPMANEEDRPDGIYLHGQYPSFAAGDPDSDIWEVPVDKYDQVHADPYWERYNGDPDEKDYYVPYALQPNSIRLLSEGTTAKTAAGQVMYHVAPRSVRESIMQHGIDWNRGEPEGTVAPEELESVGFPPGSVQPRGNYLFHSLDDAHRSAGKGGWNDIWEVNAEGLDKLHDPFLHPSFEGGALYHPDPIPPNRLRLLTDERMGKTGMAMNPDRWQGLLNQGSVGYHYTTPENIANIRQNGLRPWDEDGIGSQYSGEPGEQYGGNLEPRPGHVYVSLVDDPSKPRVKIDLNKLNPANINMDEDNAEDFVQNHPEALNALNEVDQTEGNKSYDSQTLGDWAEDWSHVIDHPNNVADSIDNRLTFAHRGAIPPEAILTDERMGKVGNEAAGENEAWGHQQAPERVSPVVRAWDAFSDRIPFILTKDGQLHIGNFGDLHYNLGVEDLEDGGSQIRGAIYPRGQRWLYVIYTNWGSYESYSPKLTQQISQEFGHPVEPDPNGVDGAPASSGWGFTGPGAYSDVKPLDFSAPASVPKVASAIADFEGMPGWTSVPKHVYNWLDQNKPGEVHSLAGDCINPKCTQSWDEDQQRELAQYGEIKCPGCGTMQTAEGGFGPYSEDSPSPYSTGNRPGGGTKSGLSLNQMGDIGEQVVSRLHNLPCGQVIHRFEQNNWPVDLLTVDQHGNDWGVEVKTNHSQSQPRFKLGDGFERQKKILYCNQNNLRQGLIGVRLNFYTDQADIFFRPQFSDTWISQDGMQHIGTVNFADLNPFREPDGQHDVPDMQAQELPF